MSKSAKKRKRAAKRRQELDRLRGVSLLDQSNSPSQPSFLESSPNPENASHLKNYGKPLSPISPLVSPLIRGGDENNPRQSSEGKNADEATKRTRSKLAASTEATTKTAGSEDLPIGPEGLASSRKRIEFVLPRVMGKADRYIFDKQARKHINEDLPTIPEEEHMSGDEDTAKKAKVEKRNETLEEILYSSKKRKLADKFEAIHTGSTGKAKNVAAAPVARKMNIQSAQHGVAMQEKPDGEVQRERKKKKKRRRSSSSEKEDSFNSERIQESVSLSQSCGSEAKKVEEGDNPTASRTNRRSLGSTSSNSSMHRENHSVDASVRTQMNLVHRQLSGRSVEEAVRDKKGLRPRLNSTDGELNLPQRGLCDEQMVLQAHRWKDENNLVHQVMPRGLVNLGNTCFLNSILQCLAYLPPFCQSLITISETKNRRPNQKLSQGQRITSSLCNLFQKVHGLRANGASEGSIAPQAIVKALPSIGTCGSRNGHKFRPGRQEDAHEFLVHLLDAMHDGELRAAGINQHASGWRDRLPVTRLDETTFIHRIFGGYFRSQVRCKACGYKSNTYDPFLDLSLEVSKKSSNSVLFALSEFTRRETLDSDNQWKCSGCKKYVCPTKQLTVFRPPLSLCIQLKRFSFDGGFGFGGRGFSAYGAGGGGKYGKKSNAAFRGGGSKITKPIEFPADLDLPLSDSRSCAYTLTGVVIHVGGSASSGHYTAYVKMPGRKGRAQWYHADDSFVEPVSERAVLRQKDAYMLFYCRKEVKLEFPSPPPRNMSTEEAKEFGRVRARARSNSNLECQEEEQYRESKRQNDPAVQPQLQAPLAHSLQQPNLRASANGTVPLTKAKIHPLAEFLNTSITAQLKKQMSPVPEEPDEEEKEEKNSTTLGVRKLALDDNESASSSSRSDSSDDDDSSSQGGGSGFTNHSKPTSNDAVHLVRAHSPAEKKKAEAPSVDPTEEWKPKTEDMAVESSSGDDESSSSASSNDEARDKEDLPANTTDVATRSHATQSINRTRVVVGHSDSRGKVKVMMGPKKRRAWVSKITSVAGKGKAFQLLGNRDVGRWDEDDNHPNSKDEKSSTSDERGRIVEKIEKKEKSRKRKMHLDRWDALLDQGKRKKTKQNPENSERQESQNPKKNVFQRIQSGIQRMNKGKAKGLFRRKKNQGPRRRGT